MVGVPLYARVNLFVCLLTQTKMERNQLKTKFSLHVSILCLKASESSLCLIMALEKSNHVFIKV